MFFVFGTAVFGEISQATSTRFFDWRSGVFTFKDSYDSLVQKVKECFLEDYAKVREMPPSERVWQAIRIRDLLEESTLSPDDRFPAADRSWPYSIR
jgi:hypothetical protein